ncbi:MAG: amino acid-binding protein [Bacteroidia bacterium]|nr:amino acid-binding protein [Bacteroidia bacterium]
MATKQLSVFLENKTGRLNDVTKILGQAGINMTAFSVADNSDFGILRVIVPEPEKVRILLKDKGFAVSLTDVIAVNIPNKAGSLDKVLDLLAEAKIYIEYMYAFSEGETASVVIKPDNMVQASEILQKHNIRLL